MAAQSAAARSLASVSLDGVSKRARRWRLIRPWNPYSEAQFKTLKYGPTFPERFGSVQDARAFGQGFFPWYNTDHRHDALGLLTPAAVHYGQAGTILAQRRLVLTAAYAAHPERFVRQPPEPLAPPTAVWINPPATRTEGPH